MGRWAFRLTGVISSVVIVVLLLWLSSGLGVPSSDWVERLGIVGIVLAFVGVSIATGVLGGLSQVARSQALSNVLKNGVFLLGVTLMLVAGADEVAELLWLQVGSLGVAAVVGAHWVRRSIYIGAGGADAPIGSPTSAHEQANPGEWRRAAGYFFAMSAAMLLLGRLDVVIVNSIAGSVQAGLYGAAARLAQAASIAGFVWLAWLQPRMAEQWGGRRWAALLRSSRIGLVGSGGTTLALVCIGWVLAPTLISLLGEGFEDAVWPFRFLLLGYVLWGVSVPSYVLLTMSGRERLVSWIVWVQVGLTLAASVPLILHFGALGGAWAWAGGMAIGSLGFMAATYFGRPRNESFVT
jgi:O-antigen/teichoic acid export membrane protein